MRTKLTLLILMTCTLLMSCASQPRKPPLDNVERYGTVAIVPAKYQPETQFITFARGPVSGGIKGGLEGAGAGFMIGFEATGYNPIGAILTGILLSPVTIPLGVAGGVNIHTPEDLALRMEQLLKKAVSDEKMSVRVSEMVAKNAVYMPQVLQKIEFDKGPEKISSAPSYSSLVNENIDTVLEIGMLRAGFKLGNKRDTIRLYMDAQARLINVLNNDIIAQHEFSFESRDKTIAGWRSNGGKALHAAFSNGYRELGERVFANLLEQPPYWPFRTNVLYYDKKDKEAYCWLKPIQPQCDYIDKKTKNVLGLKILIKEAETTFTPIEISQTPLTWQPFPRQQDLVDKNMEALNKITDISYDIRIWNWNDSNCDALVYERVQLPKPEHLLETKLKPGGKYCWSFRARFLFNDKPQFTGWSYSALPHYNYDEHGINPLDCYLDDIPDIRYYRFQVADH